MIDPANMTNYHRNQAQLEEFGIYCVLVAGKSLTVTARTLDRILAVARAQARCRPFTALRSVIRRGQLVYLFQANGIGCQRGLIEASRPASTPAVS